MSDLPSLHTATVAWAPAAAASSPAGDYTRDHVVTYGSGVSARVSAAPAYGGSADLPNPEELLVGAIASCHMLTFLAVAARRGIAVTGYVDAAVGTLARDADGRTAVTEVVLRPEVRFAAPVAADTLAQLHAAAHRGCFIAHSVRCTIRVEPR